MDKEYIKMCEKAEEIQKLCGGDTGDFVYLTQALRGYNGWQEYEKGEVEVVGNDGEYDITFGYPYDSVYKTLKADGLIWLPRQDQLQEMVLKDGSLPVFIIETIWGKVRVQYRYYQSFASMEQLWLAFVMKEKYNKTWNGEDWIKEV